MGLVQVHSGWVGLVLDAGMEGGHLLPKFGSVPAALFNGSSALTAAEVAEHLPDAVLNVTLTLSATGQVFYLTRQGAEAVISPVRVGPVVSHLTASGMG